MYSAYAARDVMFGDGPELTAAAITNGVAHPPGYPLWIMLGHLAALLPLGSLPYRVNLTAGAYHACAAGLVFASAYVLTGRRLAALFAALALALGSPLFVSWSLQAEVFSLDDLFAAAIVLLCVLWLVEPRRFRLVLPLGLLFGLGLANQQSIALLAPLPLWVAWCNRRSLPPRRIFVPWGAAAGALLAAGWIVPYLHTLTVSQHLAGWHLGAARTPGELLDVIDRRVFGSFDLVPGSIDRGGSILDRAWAMLSAAGWPAALIGAGCAGFAVRRRGGECGLVALIVAFPFLLFCVLASIDVSDESLRAIFQRFALLPLTAAAPFAAGALFFVDGLRSRLRVAAAALATCAVVALGAAQLPRLSLAGVHGPRVLYRDIARALPPHAILLTAGDSVDGPPMYFGPIERWRPDVTVIAYGLLAIPAYRTAFAPAIDVPPLAGADLAPQVRRDLLRRAAQDVPFYVTGERGIHAPGPWYGASPEGSVSPLIAAQHHVDLRAHYRLEAALESASGYGDIEADRWTSNGFGTTVRGYYAGGFFSTGYDAERLGDLAGARYWYRRALAYSSDPLIAQRLDAIAQSARAIRPVY